MDIIHFLAVAPAWAAVSLVVVLPTALVAVNSFLLHRFLSFDQRVVNNEVAGFLYSTLGVIYAVLLGLTVVAVWEQFRDADQTVEREVGALVSLYRMTDALDPAMRDAVADRLSRYVAQELDNEWSIIEQGHPSPHATAALNDLSAVYLTHEPRTRREELAIKTSLDLLTEVHKSRRARLALAGGIVPSVLWGVLFGGATIVIGFPLFFASRSHARHAAMTGLLSLLVTSILYVCLLLDFPFSGTVQVKPGELVCLRQPDCLRIFDEPVRPLPPGVDQGGRLNGASGERRQ